MAAFYPKPLVDRVQSIIDSNAGPVKRFNSIMQILLEQKIAYVTQDVSAKLMLVHPENRSRLGVNPHESHRKGAHIAAMGADLQLLGRSTAFELAPADPIRARQVQFNKRLVDNSGGMLAPVNGSERYLSVGSSHTSQFVKAVLAGCSSPQAPFRVQLLIPHAPPKQNPRAQEAFRTPSAPPQTNK